MILSVADLCSPVEPLSDGVVSLLPCGVPDLELESLGSHINRLGLKVNSCDESNEDYFHIKSATGLRSNQYVMYVICIYP